MTSDTELAELLAEMQYIYSRRGPLSTDKDEEEEACRTLFRSGVLSVSAVASVVGCSTYRVRQATKGMLSPLSRGALNPAHITYLAYMLSQGVNDFWLHKMVSEGTSVGMIADLTNIPESTLFRRLRNGE